LDKVHIFLMEIQAHRISSSKMNALAAFVDDLAGSGNNIQVFKNSVIEDNFHMSVNISQSNLKGLCFLLSLVHGREPLQSILSFQNFMINIFQVGYLASIWINYTEAVI